MLKLVPDHLREASYALGARKSRTDPHGGAARRLPGIVSGCLLAVARAAGETAPLLFTIGDRDLDNPNLFSRRQHGAVDADLQQRHLSRSPAHRTVRGAPHCAAHADASPSPSPPGIASRFALKREE